MPYYYNKTEWDNDILKFLDLPVDTPQFKKTLHNKLMEKFKNHNSNSNSSSSSFVKIIKNKITKENNYGYPGYLYWINHNYTYYLYRPRVLYNILNLFKKKTIPKNMFTMHFKKKGIIINDIEI